MKSFLSSQSSGIRNGSFVIRNGIGFTLVELMIVIAIIGVLAASLFPMMSGYMSKAKDAATKLTMTRASASVMNYIQDVGGIPGIESSTSKFVCLQIGELNQQGNCIFGRNTLSLPDLQGIKVGNMSINQPTPQTADIYIQYLTGSTAGTTKLLSGVTSYPKYVLEWVLPGRSGDTSGVAVLEPTDNELANNRCKPGQVRWIGWTGKDATSCHMIVGP